MISHMLSVGSLAAFSNLGISTAHPTPVRAQAATPQSASPPQRPVPALGSGNAAPEPTRLLPRGSLLDLSV
jgi:hypothetical protein